MTASRRNKGRLRIERAIWTSQPGSRGLDASFKTEVVFRLGHFTGDPITSPASQVRPRS